MNSRFPSAGRVTAGALAVAASAFVLAACGGSDSSDSSTAASTTPTETSTSASGGATVNFEADPSGALQYTETDVTAKAGNDTIEFDNPSSTGHDVVIEDESGSEVAKTDIVTDSTASATADLQPGTYTFYCGVPGHREAGMEGTLTVK